MSALRAWARACRPLAHANIAPPIVFGIALGAAVSSGDRASLDVPMALVALAFGILDHLVIVFFNDVADEDADRTNDAPTLVSGGSRVLVSGALTPRALTRAGATAAVFLLALSIATSVRSVWMPALALAALGLLWLYSGPPRLSYRGGGALLQGLGVGVVLPLVGCVLQTDAAPSPIAFVPSFMLGVAGNLLTAMPDAEADARAQKRTLASVRGPRIAAWTAVLISAAAITLGAFVFAGSRTPSWLGLVPMSGVFVALSQLRGVDTDKAARLRFVLAGLGAGTIAHVVWAVALFTHRG